MEDWIGAINALPPSWRPYVLLVLQVMPLVALALAGVKRAMGAPDPQRDSWVKTAAFYALIALDWLAMNSTPVLTLLKQQDNERTKQRMSLPPGGGR